MLYSGEIYRMISVYSWNFRDRDQYSVALQGNIKCRDLDFPECVYVDNHLIAKGLQEHIDDWCDEEHLSGAPSVLYVEEFPKNAKVFSYTELYSFYTAYNVMSPMLYRQVKSLCEELGYNFGKLYVGDQVKCFTGQTPRTVYMEDYDGQFAKSLKKLLKKALESAEGYVFGDVYIDDIRNYKPKREGSYELTWESLNVFSCSPEGEDLMKYALGYVAGESYTYVVRRNFCGLIHTNTGFKFGLLTGTLLMDKYSGTVYKFNEYAFVPSKGKRLRCLGVNPLTFEAEVEQVPSGSKIVDYLRTAFATVHSEYLTQYWDD